MIGNLDTCPYLVLDVYTGSNGLIHDGNLLRPMLFIDSSTIDPQTSRRLSVAVSNCGLKQRKGNSNSPSLFFWVANISLKRRKMKIQH
ncbi:putative 3-hydroxyisobutyrate dehydrogenase, mitochondrial [Vitis vinifera]|uniref:Putative 3-hydroxyisobutyrate dehydrogenase, mitochondrial n=1 Tax=Vitis vinifera TaxID=29760 RepID=A0A438HAM5_VITVI|nr:putative 3-hydroxyisobutyrate dehydrogenase, mitochondrial [Vitis vinifera]